MDPGQYLILFYDYVDDIVERRPPHRPAHLAHISAFKTDGRVVAAGPLGDPPHGAAIVFSGLHEADVDAFADADPYVVAGLVTERRVVPWTVVA